MHTVAANDGYKFKVDGVRRRVGYNELLKVDAGKLIKAPVTGKVAAAKRQTKYELTFARVGLGPAPPMTSASEPRKSRGKRVATNFDGVYGDLEDGAA